MDSTDTNHCKSAGLKAANRFCRIVNVSAAAALAPRLRLPKPAFPSTMTVLSDRLKTCAVTPRAAATLFVMVTFITYSNSVRPTRVLLITW